MIVISAEFVRSSIEKISKRSAVFMQALQPGGIG